MFKIVPEKCISKFIEKVLNGISQKGFKRSY